MLSYLRESRKLLNGSEKICLVLGNESCDLDSAVSAISLAYFYSIVKPSYSTSLAGFLPLLNIPRKSFPIKTEVSYFLRKYNINPDILSFKDDTSHDFIQKNSTILVDHHVSPYQNLAIEIFDHRPVESLSRIPQTCKTRIEQVGSCATLIGDLILSSTEYTDEFKIILQLLYGAIVLDTVNFSQKACRTTELDLNIASKIETILGITNCVELRQTTFTELVNAREDISSLTPYQLLHKDMKLIKNSNESVQIAIPGYPISVQEFIKKMDAKAAIEEFSKELNCSVVLLIGMKIIGSEVARDIGLINISNEKLFNEILVNLTTCQSPNLQLEEIASCDFLGGKFYQQGNVTATRKHILPIVKKILEEIL